VTVTAEPRTELLEHKSMYVSADHLSDKS